MRKLFMVAGLMMVATPADADSVRTARELGSFLGSETICHLQINYARVQAYIRNHVPAEDMDFADELRSQAELVDFRYGKMTTSMKVAHCEQMLRAGEALGLIN